MGYIDKISQWWPPEAIAKGIGVPGYADQTIYNYIALAFWSTNGPLDIVNIWANPLFYFGAENPFGSTNDQIQKTLKKKYNDGGVKILISAFGATEFPTTNGVDPVDCANKLGNFVLQNNLDGVDIDWEDNAAMEAGKGEAWLIAFSTKLRELLPNHIICHAPQAPYFKEEYYKNGAYMTVHKQVGKLIDFYNVQFYNQGDTKYDSYQALFLESGSFFSGTSVNEIIKRKVPSNKIVIGKPVTQADAANTGTVDNVDLGKWASQAYKDLNWYAGIMYWQYPSDIGGKAIQSSAGHLKELCSENKNCK